MKYTLLLIGLLVLYGCDSSPAIDKSTNQMQVGDGEVKEVTLSDGTKCAVGVMHGHSYGISGVSCNWKKE